MRAADPSHVAADADQMRAILARALTPATGPALHISDCNVVSGRHRDESHGTVIVSRRHRDESRGSVLYEISLVDPETGQTSDFLVTGLTLGGMRTRRLWDAARATAPPHGESDTGPLLRHYAYVPELDMFLQVFPHDIRLPAVGRLIPGPDAEMATLLLAELGPGHWQVKSWNAEAIQYRPDVRAIVRLDIQATDGISGRDVERHYFAKVYREGDLAQKAFRMQAELHECIQHGGIGLAVAKPVAFFEDINTIITSAASGTSLTDVIRQGGDLETTVPSAARAIAAFHRLDASAPLRPLDDDLNQLREAQTILQSRRPDLNGQVADIVSAVTAGLASARPSLIHGDLKPDHILIDGDNVALIDFDFIAMADPMIDVAYLAALLGNTEERSRRFGGAAGLAKRLFLDEYFAHVPESWRHRLRLHHAMMSVHKAAGLCRKANPERQELVASVIGEGHSLLTQASAEVRTPSFKRRLPRSSTP